MSRQGSGLFYSFDTITAWPIQTILNKLGSSRLHLITNQQLGPYRLQVGLTELIYIVASCVFQKRSSIENASNSLSFFANLR